MSRLLTALAATLSAFVLSSVSLACADEGSNEPETERAGTGVTSSQDSSTRARLRAVRVARFDTPVEVKSAPGYPRLMFVVEQPGRIMVLRRGRKLARPFLDIRGRVTSGGEEGLLSVGFPPDYRMSKPFYV